jgi:hypothetical protein
MGDFCCDNNYLCYIIFVSSGVLMMGCGNPCNSQVLCIFCTGVCIQPFGWRAMKYIEYIALFSVNYSFQPPTTFCKDGGFFLPCDGINE